MTLASRVFEKEISWCSEHGIIPDHFTLGNFDEPGSSKASDRW